MGSLLDPVADKVLVLSVLIVLVGVRVFPGWMVAAIAAIVGGLAAGGLWDDDVAWWALLVALVITWISGLDYA